MGDHSFVHVLQALVGERKDTAYNCFRARAIEHAVDPSVAVVGTANQIAGAISIDVAVTLIDSTLVFRRTARIVACDNTVHEICIAQR